jgi:hypothetical protein
MKLQAYLLLKYCLGGFMGRLIFLFLAVFILISEINDVFAQPLTEEEQYYKQKALEEKIYSRYFAFLANSEESTPQPKVVKESRREVPLIAPTQDGSSPRPEAQFQQENCVQQCSISKTKRSMFLSPAEAMAREKRARHAQERDLAISRAEEGRPEKIEIERRKRWRNVIELIDPQERDTLKRTTDTTVLEFRRRLSSILTVDKIRTIMYRIHCIFEDTSSRQYQSGSLDTILPAEPYYRMVTDLYVERRVASDGSIIQGKRREDIDAQARQAHQETFNMIQAVELDVIVRCSQSEPILKRLDDEMDVEMRRRCQSSSILDVDTPRADVTE